jgi:hypothetical protein
MIRALILALLLAATPAFGDGLKLPSDWSRGDTYRQTAVTALLAADWAQARYIAEHTCERAKPVERCYREVGLARSFVGEHPTVGQVNNYFATSILTNVAIAYMLPARYRPYWQYGNMLYEGFFVFENHRIGIRIGVLF